MDEQVFRETFSEIVSAIKEAGYDPYLAASDYPRAGLQPLCSLLFEGHLKAIRVGEFSLTLICCFIFCC